MGKIKYLVDLEFPNAALLEDFLEAAKAAGLAPDEYVVELMRRGLGADEPGEDGQDGGA